MNRVTAAVVDAALAGVVVGLADLIVVAWRMTSSAGAIPSTAAIVVGLAIGVVTIVGTPVVLVLRLAGRHPLGAPLASRLRDPGVRRTEALAAIAVAVVAVALVWLAGYRVVAYTHDHYRVASAAGLMASAVIVAIGLVVAIAATAGGPRLVRWLGARPTLHRLTTGRTALAVGVGVAVAVAITTDLVLGTIAPAFDAPPAYVLTSAPLALIISAAVAPSRWLPRAVTGASCGALAIAAVLGVGHADRARGAVLAHGTLSERVLRAMYTVTDGDGDGFSDRFGGGDCDDDDGRVHPRAAEVAGNGADDNCVGGDGALDPHRVAAHPSTTPDAPRRDIILVTIDSLRADHTSAYGYRRATTPVLAALAARGARFGRAISPTPLTRSALPALMFGRYRSTLPGKGGANRPGTPEAGPAPLATILRDAGYRAGAVVSHDDLLNKQSRFGFKEIDEVSTDPVPEHDDNSDAVTDHALAWLAAQPADRPVLLWIHYIDPHFPYAPRAEAPRFGGDDAYDRSIAFNDAQLGRLLDGVRSSRGDGAIVAVTADHGEAFGEHGTRYHGKSLYDELVHVPLVIAVPGVAATEIAATVSLVDLAPTLLDLVGVTAPAGMNGRSLAAAIRGDEMPAHDVLGELFRTKASPRNLVALFRDRRVVIRDLDGTTVEAYDVDADPGERHDLSDTALGGELAAALDAAIDRDLGALPDEEPK